MKDIKIYGLCLERLRYQITKAKQKQEIRSAGHHNSILLESFMTADIEEIIDILELYDLQEHTPDALKEKLEDLAYTVSLLLLETIQFGHTREEHLGIYLTTEAKRRSPLLSETVSV